MIMTPTWRHCQTFLTLFCLSCQAELLVQFSFQYHHWFWSYDYLLLLGIDQKSGNWKYTRLLFVQYLETGKSQGNNFGTDVSYNMLPNAAICQGYSFYCFWVVKGKPAKGRFGWVGEVDGITLSIQVRVNFSEIFKWISVHFIKLNKGIAALTSLGFRIIYLYVVHFTYAISKRSPNFKYFISVMLFVALSVLLRLGLLQSFWQLCT